MDGQKNNKQKCPAIYQKNKNETQVIYLIQYLINH